MAWPPSNPTWWSTPVTTWPTATRSTRCSRPTTSCWTCPGCFRVRLQRLLRAAAEATRCATCCPTTGAATPTRRRCRGPTCRRRSPSAGWLDLTNELGDSGGRRAADRLRRRRRPPPGLRPARPGRRTGRPHRRSAAGGRRTRRTSGCSTSSPATATTRSSPGTPTAARSVCRSSARSPPTATSTTTAPRACTGTRPTPAPATRAPAWLHVSAGVGTVAVRPDPRGLPPRGDAAHAHLALTSRHSATGDLSRHRNQHLAPQRPACRGPGNRFQTPALRYAHPGCGGPGHRIGLWRSLVARFVRDEEAAGSNPVSPTL